MNSSRILEPFVIEPIKEVESVKRAILPKAFGAATRCASGHAAMMRVNPMQKKNG